MKVCRLPSFIIFLATLFLCAFFSGTVSAEIRTFELQHRPVGELAETVRALVNEEARVAAYRNTLVVNASTADLQEIARLVVAYDRPQQMLRIIVDQGNSIKTHSRDFSTSGRLYRDDGTIAFQKPKSDSYAGGGSIRIREGQSRINIKASDRSSLESRSASQFITVMEGEPARISVGRSVPFTSQMLRYCRQHPAFIETISYENVDTGFEVLPEMHNNMVDLDIRPFMAFLDSRNPQQIVFHDLSTKVSIPVGTWFELGGQMQVQNDLSREILGRGVVGSENSSLIRVRVEPQ